MAIDIVARALAVSAKINLENGTGKNSVQQKGTTASYDNMATFGKFNKNSPDNIFEIGYGTDTNNRLNAFEVLKDGRAKVQSAPTENDDVVRLQELNAVEQGNYSDITNIDLNTGDTTVEYDTGLGITVNAKGTVIHENGATEQPTTKFELPIIAGAGIVIDKAEGEEKIVIRAVFGDDIRVLVIDETAVFLKGATVSGKSAVFVSGAAVVNNQIIF